MKKIITKLSFMVALFFLFQQSQAQMISETNIKFNKEDANAFVANYNMAKSDLSKVADEYFSKNVTGKSSKVAGFRKYTGAFWRVIQMDQADIYYKVDGNKKSSDLTVMVSKGYNNFISSATNPEASDAIKTFFRSLNTNIADYNLNQNIESKKKNVAKLEKQYQKGLDNEKKMKSEISKLESKIEKNKSDYQSKAAELEKEKGTLQELLKQQK